MSDYGAAAPPRRCVGIVNPYGGLRRGSAILEQVTRSFSEAGVSLDAHVTRDATHAADLAQRIDASNYDCLCVIGGDGTVHDVVDGLMRRETRPEIPLGVFPAGTGNTIHQEVDCCDVAQATSAVLTGRTRWLDVVRVEAVDLEAYCMNVVGWGAVADINIKAEKLRTIGRRRYVVASLWQMLLPRKRRARLILDGDAVDDEFQFVIACVTKSTGTGMLLAPHAQIDDGLMDVVVIRDASRLQLLKFFRHIFDGSHLALPFVEYRQVRTLVVESSEGTLNIDGENSGAAPFTARIVPRALRIYCNAAQ